MSMIAPLFPKGRREKGQSLVELALTLTLLITLLAGVVDLGNAFFSWVAMRDAAQEGALYGSFALIDDADADGYYDAGEAIRVAAVRQRVLDVLNRQPTMAEDISEDPNVVRVNVTVIGSPCEGNGLEVEVEYDYPLSMPFIGSILGKQTIAIRARVTDTILRPMC